MFTITDEEHENFLFTANDREERTVNYFCYGVRGFFVNYRRNFNTVSWWNV